MTTPTTIAAELPEALRIADELDAVATAFRMPGRFILETQAAAELRRLHRENEALRAQPAGAQVPEAVLQAIRAAGMHLIRGMNDVYSLIPAMNATAQPAGAATPAAGAAPAYAWVYINKYGVDSIPASKEWCEAMVSGHGGSMFPLYKERKIEAAPQPAVTAGTVDALDAARWRAFIRSARIRFFGWAGADIDGNKQELNTYGEANGNHVHFGAEFWTVHDAKTERPDVAARLLTTYADAALAAQRATHQEDQK